MTTIFINSIYGHSHFGEEPSTFSVSTSPIAERDINIDEVNTLFASFYDTGNESTYHVKSVDCGNVEVKNNSVWFVKCTPVNNRWCLIPIAFATEKKAKAWLKAAQRKSNDGVDVLLSKAPFDDLQNDDDYSENWGIEIVEIQFGAIGWSEWSND